MQAGGSGGHVLVNAPMPGGAQPSTIKGRRGCCHMSLMWRILLSILVLVVIAAAVLIPLLATGVIKVGKPHTSRARRISYDPLYYGNLHPYLYPSERAQFGVSTDYDVIVIGAGVAGLAAATALQEQGGLDVLDRVGGRVLSVPFAQRKVELGAQWMVGAATNPVADLATAYQVPRALTTLTSQRTLTAAASLLNASQNVGAMASTFEESLQEKQAALAAEQPPADAALAQLVADKSRRSNAEQKRALEHSLTTPLAATQRGAALAQLSTLYYGAEVDVVGPNALSLGGMDAIPRGLAAKLNATCASRVRVSTPVASVRVGDLNATVETASGRRYTAQYVICTAPLGVLQAGGVRFVPPLPADTAGAVARLGVGLVDTVHLLFDQVFWDPAAEYITLLPGGSADSGAATWGDFISMHTFTNEPMLVALPSGAMAAAVETMTDAEVIASALAALRGVYGAAVPAQPSAFMVTRWGLNPYARGTHSYYAVGSSPADRATLSEPVGGSLLFAGEAASVLHPSTLHGAYLSGDAQAGRILAAMEFPQEGDTCSAECYGAQDVQVPTSSR